MTEWHLEAPVQEVWEVISKPLEWPQWWPGVVQVTEVRKGDSRSLGGIQRYTWKSQLPYALIFTLELTEREEEKLLKGRASGDLEGWGITYFYKTPEGTLVRYEWQVATLKPWMNRLAFLLKPVFAYNHRVVMRWGAKALARKLGCRLIRY